MILAVLVSNRLVREASKLSCLTAPDATQFVYWSFRVGKRQVFELANDQFAPETGSTRFDLALYNSESYGIPSEAFGAFILSRK